MKLQDNEIRDIIKYLEAEEPRTESPLTPLDKGGAKGGGILSQDEIQSLGLISNGSSLPYNPDLVKRAKEMRGNMTPAERKLWYEVLSNKKLENLRWLRQRPIDHYIADFYCASLKLIVEVDGESHATQEEYDQERTSTLERYGIKVVRFTNEDVMQNLEGVFLKLQKIVDERL